MPSGPKPAHYRGSFHVRARRVRQAAYADPSTRCGRCGLTLAQHAPHKTGRAARWTAGHVVDSDPRSMLRPEASTCNMTAGASLGGRRTAARAQGFNASRQW